MEINVNVKDFSATLAEVRDTIKELKDYKRMLIIHCLPRGEHNAKSAKELFGDDWRCLSNLEFCGNWRRGGYENVTLGDTTIYRKKRNVTKQYANVNNPNDVITKTETMYVYWRD